MKSVKHSKIAAAIIFLFYVQLTTQHYIYEVKYLDVPLDHFTFTSNATFKLRYLTYKCGEKGENNVQYFIFSLSTRPEGTWGIIPDFSPLNTYRILNIMAMPPHLPIILRVWESDYGVPSIDPQSLQLIMLFKVNKVNIIIQHAYLPQWLDIPSIQFNKTTVCNKSELLTTALSLCKTTTDMALDIGLQSRLKAYEKYFLECFADAFYFDCWLNNANYEHAIKTWYNNVIPFPFSYFYLKKMHEIANERYKSLVGARDQEMYKMQQLTNATRCLEDFASLLGDGRLYFFGEFPTSLDITIYSYLAIALKIPLPDSQLQYLVKNHHMLVRFVRNLNQLYFPHMTTQFKHVEPVNTSSDRASSKSLIIAGFCATAAMFLYACSIGLVKPKFSSLGRIHNMFS